MSVFGGTSTPLDRPIDTTRRSGVSKIFKQSVPQFILDEYPLFVDFLEAYYEWLDQHGNPVEFLQNGDRYFDIDTTTDEFLEHFKTTFLDGFPKTFANSDPNTTLDERALIKNIREFYKIKGGEKSIRLLFKLIADTDSTVEYPRDYIFILSGANYKNYHKMYVLKDYNNLRNGFDPTAVEGIIAVQYERLTELIASAQIESAYELSHNGKEYYALILTNPSGVFIQADFSPIRIVQGATSHDFYPVPLVSSLEIVNGGSGYSVGEFFTIGNTAQDYIKGFVSQTDFEGKIKRVELFKTPVNYNGGDSLRIESAFGTGADFSVVQSILSEPIDEYSDNKNLLSKVSRLQDSYEYQQFSYRVKSRRSLEEYIDALKKVLHPAGFVLFNALYNNIQTSRDSEYITRVKVYEDTKLGSYASYSLPVGSGSGSTLPWNPYGGSGDPNPTKSWGLVFSGWEKTNPNGSEINPSEGLGSVPNFGGTAYQNFGSFAPTLTSLPNSSQSQEEGITHWLLMPHPSGRPLAGGSAGTGQVGITAGTLFRNIKLGDVLRMPVPIVGDA